MRIVSVKQPWAWAVANGYAPLLNRHHDAGPYTKHKYLGIYALPEQAEPDDIQFVCNRIGVDRIPPAFYEEGGVIGVSKIETVTSSASQIPLWYRQWRDEGYRYAWSIKDAVPISPVRFDPGEGGLWSPSQEIADTILGLYRKEISTRLLKSLRNKRKEQGISQVYLAKLLGYTERHIINIENRGTGSLEKAIMLLDVLGYPVVDVS
jgi:DNA-binding XRE family transcriptional regulator